MGSILKYLGIFLMILFSVLFLYAFSELAEMFSRYRNSQIKFDYLIPNITAAIGLSTSGILTGIGMLVEKKFTKI